MSRFSSSRFFLLRSPLLPYDTLNGLDDDQLGKLVREDAIFREAIFLSSPDFYDRMMAWAAGETPSADTQKILYTLRKYVFRMSYRCTPFGTSAGISHGKIDETTKLKDSIPFSDRRFCRLDMTFLSTYIDKILQEGEIRLRVKFYSNNTLYDLDGAIRYVEYIQRESSRTHELVGLESNEFIQKIMDLARNGADYQTLCKALVEPDIDEEDAQQYIDELIAIKLLVSELELSPEGEDELARLVILLEEASHPHAEAFGAIKLLLDQINGSLLTAHDGVTFYKRIIEKVENLDLEVDKRFLIQVDLYREAHGLALGNDITEQLFAAQSFLSRIKTMPSKSELEQFIEAFQTRYDYAEVPLLQALDPEVGIGYPFRAGQSNDSSVLTANIGGQAPAENLRFVWTSWRRTLLEKYNLAMKNGEQVICLSDSDVQTQARFRMPTSAYSVCKLFSHSEEELEQGEFKLLHILTSGPSSIDLISRFCYMDPQITSYAKDAIEDEYKGREEGYAEILHINQPRAGNISKHPSFYDLKIPILSNVQAGANAVPLADLWLSVRAGKLVLRSKRLDKIIVPRLSTAHNFTHNTISYYRFLCDLQYQGTDRDIHWDWGMLINMPFLPRVEYGKVILSRASWLIADDEIKQLSKFFNGGNLQEIEIFLTKRAIPRHITIREADYELPIDMMDLSSLDVLLRLISKKSSVRLEENLYAREGLSLCQGGKTYSNNLIIPFSVKGQSETARSPQVQANLTKRSFSPGDEWLYAKIYCSPKTSDKLLVEVLSPFLSSLIQEDLITKWFFIRYNDPDYHIRLRLLVSPEDLGTVLVRLNLALKRYTEVGKISTFKLDTYDRELERYPLVNYQETESLFFDESKLVVRVLQEKNELWKFALDGVDRLLDDFGYDLNQKMEATNYWQAAFKSEFHIGKGNIAGFKDKYRKLRHEIENRLSAEGRQEYDDFFRERSAQTRAMAQEIAVNHGKPSINHVNSYIHMFLNRLFAVNPRKNEMVIYDLLFQYYKSTLARKK